MSERDQMIEEEKTMTKKKQATRRQQRYKAKQKLMNLCELASAQAMNVSTVNVVAASPINNKRTCTEVEVESNDVLQSFSQLSIVQETLSSRREKTKRLRAIGHCSAKKKRRKRGNISSIPNYLNVPDRKFQQMFLQASEHVIRVDRIETLRQCLSIKTNVASIRRHACLLDKLLYSQLQQSLWAEYFHIGSTEDVWASEVQDKIKRHMIYNVQPHTRKEKDPLSFVIDYRKMIDDELQKIENQLNDHVQRSKSIFNNGSQENAIDFSALVKAFVRRGQHRLEAEMKSKRRLLEFDCEAHRLTKVFFDLQPTEQQV